MNKIKNPSNLKNIDMKFSLLVIVLIVWCTFLCIIATFTQLKIFIPVDGKLKVISYIPQIPAVLFIAGLLGKRYGTISIVLYIITGLFFVPIFAHGGGLEYILNMNFGYILSFVPAVFFTSKILEKKVSFLTVFFANFIGLLIIHFIGIIYLSAILLITKESFQTVVLWISNQSLNNLFIDFIFGFVGISFGCFLKHIFKKYA